MGKKGCIPGATQKLETESMIFGETSQGVGYSMALGKSLRVHPFGWFFQQSMTSPSAFFLGNLRMMWRPASISSSKGKGAVAALLASRRVFRKIHWKPVAFPQQSSMVNNGKRSCKTLIRKSKSGNIGSQP